MHFQVDVKKQRRRRTIYIWMFIALASLLVAATYTWFSISQTPRISDMAMYVNAPAGLELAPSYDSEEWVQQLDFAELVEETSALKPVTWSNEQGSFFSMRYGLDGRMTGEWDLLTDEENANREGGDGYYTMCTFYARAGVAMTVSLSPAQEVADGVDGAGTYVIGMPMWDAETLQHNDGGTGAEYAIRVGLRITPVDPITGSADGTPEFFIYEPNCSGHVIQAGETTAEEGYLATSSIDGTEGLIDEEHLITQSISTWTEADPVQRKVVIHEMGEFLTDTELFSLAQGGMVKIDAYIWLEGQDVDCTNVIGHDAKIFASIQFAGDVSQGGMVPIY